MFYKILNEETKEYTFGPCVYNVDYLLLDENHSEYELPIDGWYWFDTEEEAKTFFGIENVLPQSE